MRLQARLRCMSDWTLGSVKSHHFELEAVCEQDGCRLFWRFDLDRLIEEAGPDFAIADIPPMTCQSCGGPLKVVLASIPPGQEDEE